MDLPRSKSLLGFLLHLYLMFGRTHGVGQWVFLSRPDSSVSSSSSFTESPNTSTSPADFCVLGVQSHRANVSASATSPNQRLVRFRGADTLARTRPLDRKSYSDVFITRDPRAGCVDADISNPFPMVKGDVKGKMIVQVIQCFSDPNDKNNTVCPRCCQYPTKAAVAETYAAAGYVALVQSNSSSSLLPPLPNMTMRCGDYGDLDPDSLASLYDIVIVYAEDVDGVLEWILENGSGKSNNSSPRIVVWDRVFFPWENVFNWVLIGFIATFSMTTAAYASGRLSYQLYRQRLAARICKYVRLMNEAKKNGTAVAEQESEEGDEKGCSAPDVVVGLVAFVLISSFLILIYFVKWIAVPIFLVIFAMSSLSLFTLTRSLIDRLPFGATRLRCVMHFPCGCCGVGRNCCNWQIREVLAAIVFLSLGWTWYFFRHDKIVILILHNFLGFSLVYHVANGIRVTRFQACVYPCVLLLIYDVFMVFITPFMTAGGMSVMESVARGTEGDDLPLVFKIPALFPTTENICSEREVAGLLGFGDVVLPAMLASYMVLVGFVLEKPKLYLAATFLSYPISLVVTIVSLYVMKVAQPALLYIVPIMMIAIVITAAAAGDLKTLWKTDMMMYPRTIEMKHLSLIAACSGESNQMEDGGADSGPNVDNVVVPVSKEEEEEEEEGRKDRNERPVQSNQNESSDTSSLIHRNVGDRTENHT